MSRDHQPEHTQYSGCTQRTSRVPIQRHRGGGWVELAHDQAIHIVASRAGYFRQQRDHQLGTSSGVLQVDGVHTELAALRCSGDVRNPFAAFRVCGVS